MLGGRTYRMLAPFWSAQTDDRQGPARALNALPKYVVSTTLEASQWQGTERIVSQRVEDEIAWLKKAVDGYVLLPGSATLLAATVRAELLDDVRLRVHPHVMGEGRRWTVNGLPRMALELDAAEALDLGVVRLDDRVQPA